jgi:hypothetical protein
LAFRERLLSALKVDEPQELLKDMRLKNPEISVLISKSLGLDDDSFVCDFIEGRYGRKEYHLIKMQNIRRCLLQIPPPISALQVDNWNKVWDAIDFLRDSLLKKYGDFDLGLFLIYEGQIHRGFNPYLVDCKNFLKNSRFTMKGIDIEDIMYLKNESEDRRQQCLKDYFELRIEPSEIEDYEARLASLTKILEIHKSNLDRFREQATIFGEASVPPMIANSIVYETNQIEETRKQIGEIKRKMGSP